MAAGSGRARSADSRSIGRRKGSAVFEASSKTKRDGRLRPRRARDSSAKTLSPPRAPWRSLEARARRTRTHKNERSFCRSPGAQRRPQHRLRRRHLWDSREAPCALCSSCSALFPWAFSSGPSCLPNGKDGLQRGRPRKAGTCDFPWSP